jgi:hypothetical protein
MVVSALVGSVGLAACGTSGRSPQLSNGVASSNSAGPAPGSSSSTPPSSSTTPSSIKHAVKAAWTDYWHVYDTLPKPPRSKWKPLVSKVAVNPIRKELLVATRKSAKDGLSVNGRTVLHIKSVKLNSGGKTATLMDCQDDSHGGSVDVKTGRQVTTGIPHNLIRGTLTKGQDGRWRVKQIGYLSGVKCEY